MTKEQHMSTHRAVSRSIGFFLIVGMLVSIAPLTTATQAQASIIIIDGVKETVWGDPLAMDATLDMTEPNLDLQGLYVVEDADNCTIGFDATASTRGMAYGIYLDTDLVDGSGATSDPWGRAVNAVSAHLPEHTLYVWHEDWGALQDVQLNHWDGSGWSYDSLISQGGEQGYGPAEDWIEYRVPKAALGDPTRIALEVFTTGGSGQAQDTVPSDPNVAYAEPDWGGDTTTLSAFALFPPPPPLWYARGDLNGWGLADPMYDDGTMTLDDTVLNWRNAGPCGDWRLKRPGKGESDPALPENLATGLKEEGGDQSEPGLNGSPVTDGRFRNLVRRETT
jgi:hypothetical protein